MFEKHGNRFLLLAVAGLVTGHGYFDIFDRGSCDSFGVLNVLCILRWPGFGRRGGGGVGVWW